MGPTDELLGASNAIAEVREQIRQLLARGQHAQRLPPLLLQGETGTGKGLLAGLIHRNGPRAAGPFIDVSCAAIPEALVEAELFGFERGAFTDARQAKPGLLYTAHRGTIFLDEVALLPITLQAKLLKVIEEQTVRRLGSTRAERIDVQVIAASNEDLAAVTRVGRFRQDLFHRLAVVTLTLPPLRERLDDVVLLAEHFLSRACVDYGLAPARRLAADARRALQAYRWPGNVRELSNVIERAVLLGEQPTITAAMLRLPASTVEPLPLQSEADAGSFDDRLYSIEREQLIRALHDTNWNISLAAIRLGITRNRLRYRIEKHALRAGQLAVRHTRRLPRSDDPAGLETPTSVRQEQRHLALMRADLVRSSAADGGPDSLHMLAVVADKIRSFGGQVEELTERSVVGAFGLEPVEDAPNAAALAALAIHKAVERASRINARVPHIRIAIDAIKSTVGWVDGVGRTDLEDKRKVDATLIALSTAGQPGSILISCAAAPFLERRFELAHESAPESHYRLTRPELTGFGLAGRALAQFVGRRRELMLVNDRLAQAERSHGQIVAIVGEPGVGKSRFAYELTRQQGIRGWRVLTCRAMSYGVSTPSLPVVELLRRYFQIDDADAPAGICERVRLKTLFHGQLQTHLAALLALLGASADDPAWCALEPAQRRQRTIDAVKQLLLQESLAQPLVVIFEDLHWIDTETQAVLDSLAESLPTARVLLLVTYRPEYEHHWGAKTYYTQLRIDPLTPEIAQTLLHLLMGDHASLQPLKQVLIERTEGNPFFLEESVRALTETGVLQGERGAYRHHGPVADLEVPATVHAVLAVRIDRLPAESKRVLQAAAVVGKDVPYGLLQAMVDVSEEQLRSSLRDLQAREFLYEGSLLPDRAYTFKHALTHEVAYGSVTHQSRRILHSSIVEVLERLRTEPRSDQLERLAYHSRCSELWDKAVTYLAQAGAKALARSANREAAAWFEQALAALSHCTGHPGLIRQGIDLRLDLRNALHPQGEFDRILEALQEAQRLAELAGDQERLARVLGYLALTHAFTGAPERALAEGHRALEIVQTLPRPGLAAATNCVLGMIYQSQGQYRRSMTFSDATVDSLQGELARERAGMPVLPAVYARHVALLALAPLGEYKQAVKRAEEGFHIADAVNHPISQLYMFMASGFLHAYQGEFSAAIRLLEHGRTLCEVTGSRLIFGWVASYLGSAYVHCERVREGVSLLEQGIDTLATLHVLLRRSLVLGWLGEAYALAGRMEEAAQCAEQALGLARAQNERGHEAEALRVLGDIAVGRGGRSVEAAEDCYRRAMAIGEELEMRPLVARCHLGLGRMHLRTGEASDGQTHLQLASTQLSALRMRYWTDQADAERIEVQP